MASGQTALDQKCLHIDGHITGFSWRICDVAV